MPKPRGKFIKWLQPKNLMLLESWTRKLTNEQIAANIGIAPKTLYAWMNKYPEIREAVERGKEVVVSEVENALLKRATGYTETVDKVKVLNDGGIVRYKEDVHYPPDTTAAIFALKNMDPVNWRDKQDVEVSGGMDGTIKINIVPDKDD